MKRVLKFVLYVVTFIGLLYIAQTYLGGYNTYTIVICIILLCTLDWIIEKDKK